MKNLKSLVAILVAIMLITASTVVMAVDVATISNSKVEGNKVTFTIKIPEGAGLRGDTDDNGVVDAQDIALITEYLDGTVGTDDINVLYADADKSQTITAYDKTTIDMWLAGTVGNNTNSEMPVVTLFGTLADESKITDTNRLTRVDKTTYTVTVTVPDKSGTIGINVGKDMFVYPEYGSSEKLESEEVTITSSQKENANLNKTITISDGRLEGKTVIFDIALPTGIGFIGDANGDGVIDEKDKEAITNYNLDTTTKINELNADVDLSGAVELADVTKIEGWLTTKYSPISLDGTLAEKSTYKLVKTGDGKYSVVVTIPENTDGTIGVTVKANTVAFAPTVANKAVSSKLFTIKTETPKEDDTTAKKNVLPKAGLNTTALAVIAIVAVAGVAGFIRYKNIDK